MKPISKKKSIIFQIQIWIDPIQLFLWTYSQFGYFSEFTANSALSPNVILSVYWKGFDGHPIYSEAAGG